MIGEELWNERFGSDPSLVGKPIRLDGAVVHRRRHRAARARHPARRAGDSLAGVGPDALLAERAVQRRSNYLYALGRLAPGATRQTAHAELVTLFDGIVAANPAAARRAGEGAVARRRRRCAACESRCCCCSAPCAWCCSSAATNVASLLLARAVQRRRELAIRSALGGSRRQLMRPVLEREPRDDDRRARARAGARVGGRSHDRRARGRSAAAARGPSRWTFASSRSPIALAALVAIVCGGLPAWRSAAVDPQDALRDGRGGGTSRAHHRVLRTLVVAEVALSLVLLVGAGLVLKGFAQLMSRDPGFDPEPILTLQDDDLARALSRWQLGAALPRARRSRRSTQIPGVDAAVIDHPHPVRQLGLELQHSIRGPAGRRPCVACRSPRTVSSTPEFFQVTKQRLDCRPLARTAGRRSPGIASSGASSTRRS